MTFLPIVDRELRVAARLTATYRNRTLTAGAVAAVAFIMLMFGNVSAVRASIGSATFHTLSTVAVIFCVIEGARKTADCLSEEKREGTLGLLFLTDLKGYDVVLGKLVSRSLTSFYGLLTILPILGMPLLVGGVMAGEFWRMVLALMNILFFSLCTGMWVSSWSRTERESIGRTALLVILFAVATIGTTWHPIFGWNPISAFRTSFASRYTFEADAYWRSLLGGQLLSWLMLIWASLAAQRTWQERAVRAPIRRRWLPGGRVREAQRRAEMLDINPAYWLAARNMGLRISVWIWIGTVAVVCGLVVFANGSTLTGGLIGVIFVINLILKMRVASYAANSMAEARRNNALEMMLATPLRVEDIIRGHLLALRRAFLAPVIAILLLEAAGLFAIIVAEALNRPSAQRNDQLTIMLLAAAIGASVYLTIFFLDIFAVIWAGMWFGLTTKKEGQAAGRTILLVLIAPLLGTVFMCIRYFGVVIFFGWPIFWIVWASGKLRREFRTIAASQFDARRADSGWIPGVGPLITPARNVPPIIRP